MKLKKNIKALNSSDFYYDLFEGGYIKPEDMLKEGADKVNDAISTIQHFYNLLESNDLLEEV